MIYADNAATTVLSDSAFNAMLPYLKDCYGNPSSLYGFAQQAKEALEQSRSKVAECLNAKTKEIIFTSGGSESDNQAILSAAEYGKRNGKRHVISTAFEHHAVLHTLEKLKKQGFEITLLEVGCDGVISAEQVEKAITPQTCLVTVMFANNEIGTVQPISEIGRVCRKNGVIFHTDAVQAVGHVPIDVDKMNIDMLSLSAHKFHGPKGIGALYVRKGVFVDSLISGGAQEFSRRAGTENVPAIVGLATALQEACRNITVNNQKLIKLRNKLIDGLKSIPYSELNGSVEHRLANNVNFCFEGVEGESLLLLLDDKGIAASSGSACTSGSLEPSHVLLAIGRPHEVAHGSLRLTLGEDITERQVDYIIESVRDVVGYLRSISPLWRDLVQGKRKHIFKE